MIEKVYAFAFKGLLTEEALDKAGRKNKSQFDDDFEQEIADRLNLAEFDDDLVARGKKMAIVYAAIFAFERSVREFVSNILLENLGENWWDTAVSSQIRKKSESRRDEEEKIKWHTSRGQSLIQFTEFGDLATIMLNNWTLFEPHIQSLEWAKQIFKSVERSRNVIMHSGELGIEDIERVSSSMRDWMRQVGE
ncbi:Swt1 family HEPN domain-containing protein [Algoriphagus namhaensis]